MTYHFESFKSLEAACSQYTIKVDKPVQLTLYGPRSYCYLKGIVDPKLKEVLTSVGIEFEKTKRNTFFNFSHTFTPVETREEDESNDHLVKEIFAFVQIGINEQTKGALSLELTDMTKLVVEKAEDRSYTPPRRAYELGVTVSEKAVEAAQKAGLKFEQFGCGPSNPDVVYYQIRTGEF